MRRPALLTALVALLALAGCTTTAGHALPAGARASSSAPGIPAPSATTSPGSGRVIGSPAAVARYGYGPPPRGALDYQDDVVPIGTGPDAILAVSDDWTSYTLDGSAPGVSDLAVGKIMFASSVAVGRIVQLTHQGGNVVVRIAPVELADVVRSGTFDVHQALDPNSFDGKQFDQDVGWVTDSGKGTDIAMPPGLHRPGRALAGGLSMGPGGPSFRVLTGKPPTAGDQVAIGEWTAKPTFTANRLGLELIYHKADLVVDGSVMLRTDHLDLSVTGDPRHDDFSMVLRGVRGVTLDLAAGLGPGADPASGNRKVEGELPLSWSVPLYVGGMPVTLQIGFTLSVSTALGAKNATIHARGDYSLAGDIGMIKGVAQQPELTVNESLLNMDGISLTASGLVVGVGITFGLGVGIPMAMAGPHLSFSAASGIAKGTQIAINADCRFASLDLKAAVGASVSVSPWVEKLLQSYVDPRLKLSGKAEKVVFHVHREASLPNVAACTI